MSDTAKPNRWAAIRGVAGRDLLEFVRDRRTLFVTLLMPMAMYPILALASTLGLRTALLDIDARQAPLPIKLVLSGVDAPDFVERINSLFQPGDPLPADWPASILFEIESAVAAKHLIDITGADAWIHVAPGALATLDGQDTLSLEVHLANERRNEPRLRRHILAVVRAVADDARNRRVQTAGLPASLLEPIAVRFADEVIEPAGVALDGVLPTAVGAVLVLLALLTATGGFYPAIDAIAGEKERGTIETLLITPASTADIMTGKFLAVFTVTLVSLAANALSLGLTVAVLLRLLPSDLDLGVSTALAASCAGVAIVAFAGLAAVAAAACLAVTSAAHSTKEAQNTLTPVILLTSGLASASLVPGVGGPLVALVPFAGQVWVTREALVRESSLPVGFLLMLSVVSSIVMTWVLLRAATMALADEEVLFRGPDSAAGLTTRPAPRDLPTPMQGFGVAMVAFALLWYANGLAPADPIFALPIQQAVLLGPLAIIALWQRVNQWRTFRLVWPSGPGRGALTLFGAAMAGAGLFVTGAAVLLAVRGSELSPAAREMAEQLVALLISRPWWVGWLLISILPAVCEELFFRGWMLASFSGKRPSRGRAATAILLQAAVFAAFHLIPERMPQTFVLGAVLGWMTFRTGSLVPAIVAHAAHNAVPLVFLGLAGSEWLPDLGGDGLPPWVAVSAVTAAVAGLAIVRQAGSRRA
jgi:sodium transport system permease protein